MHLHLHALAADRVAELAQEPRHRWSGPTRSAHAGPGRRALARVLVAISLASAAAVRRLDACLADDLAPRVRHPDGA